MSKPIPERANNASLWRRLAAEGLGTTVLLAAVVGSGIMGERLSGGNVAVALLANALATGAVLVVLIAVLGPISGAHFNPAVTLFFAARRELGISDALAYACVQAAGAVFGVFAAHAMFGTAILEISRKLRDGPAQAFSEFVATLGLLGTIAGACKYRPQLVAPLVGLYIGAAYWFTASTSFANPAVTLARALTDSFSGIAPRSVPAFVAAQFVAACVGIPAFTWLFVLGDAAGIAQARAQVERA
jgi:glycerol uptake facilitator-like aquaporin